MHVFMREILVFLNAIIKISLFSSDENSYNFTNKPPGSESRERKGAKSRIFFVIDINDQIS